MKLLDQMLKYGETKFFFTLEIKVKVALFTPVRCKMSSMDVLLNPLK